MQEPRRILVIEDHDDQRAIAAVFLEHFGFAVDTAASAEEGLRLAQAHRPDLIVLDLMMPDVDGPAAFERLRADEATAGVPVVAFSGYTDLFTGRLNGYAAVLPKTAGLEKLLAVVRDTLGPDCAPAGS